MTAPASSTLTACAAARLAAGVAAGTGLTVRRSAGVFFLRAGSFMAAD
ncbi:MAG: hypothetical protein RIE31_09595 [Alphaproteobacteria bacterium]